MELKKLTDAIGGATRQEEFKVGESKIVLRTLTQKEKKEITSATSGSMNPLNVLEEQRVPILARSIVSIDGVPIQDFEDVKERINDKTPLIVAIEQLLETLDSAAISVAYDKYFELDQKRRKELGQVTDFFGQESLKPPEQSGK